MRCDWVVDEVGIAAAGTGAAFRTARAVLSTVRGVVGEEGVSLSQPTSTNVDELVTFGTFALFFHKALETLTCVYPVS